MNLKIRHYWWISRVQPPSPPPNSFLGHFNPALTHSKLVRGLPCDKERQKESLQTDKKGLEDERKYSWSNIWFLCSYMLVEIAMLRRPNSKKEFRTYLNRYTIISSQSKYVLGEEQRSTVVLMISVTSFLRLEAFRISRVDRPDVPPQQ